MSKSLFILGLFILGSTPSFAEEANGTVDTSLCDTNMAGFAKLENREVLLDLFRQGALESGRLNTDIAKEVVLPSAAAICPQSLTKQCRTILKSSVGLADWVICPPALSAQERIDLMRRAAQYWSEHAIY
ncbi:hypothetical protein K2X30_03280 [bacterium]|nr:hypothetical protein [bacterium]